MEKIKKHIANLKVAGKLKLYRMTVLVMTFFLVLVALISTLVIRSNIEKITEVWSPALEDLQELETMTAKYRIKQYQHLVESDDAVMTSCEEEIQKLESQIQDTDANLEAIMSADRDAQEGQDDYEVANAAWEEYRAASDEILKLSREGKQQEAAKLMIGEVYEEYKAFAEKLTTLRDKFQVELDRAKTMANVCTIIIFVVIVAAGLAIAVVTTLIGRIITNSITEPVEQIEAAVASLRKGELSNVEMLTYESEDELGGTIRNLKEAMGILADYVSEISVEVKAIAQGDLTRNGDDITDFLGDFSELKTSLLYILKRFNSTLTEIRNLAEQVSSNASEVENASKSLADGATEQAGVIEELNATIDTVVDLAADTAKETQSASARVKTSANKANEEKEKMNELLTEMEHITEISKEIGNIITDIEDIASQTNLLSLNASIEAARAGEAGRGFAVVADQIGKLAADSAKSAVNTRDLIDKTLVEIDKGNNITRTTADAFNQIIADMESFAEIAQNTMEKANSQAESLEQIGQGIEQLSGVVQGNAASSEENTAISVNLAEQVSSNASEVENASKSLADGATEQAGVIEELNATIDTVVDLAADTAKETQSASARVKASVNKANEEKEKMNELLTEIEHITEISKEIGNIITDIEAIASQTNLLSLNASIEAARAGEAGRGFAVVADQIGKLAADSAKSAVNTRDLIDKTLVEIEKGNTITRTTADAFNQIIADMESFAELAQNTMEKANSQAESLEQIGQGMEQLSGVVQGNAASSEENTAISINLAEGAAKMHDRVNIFKLF